MHELRPEFIVPTVALALVFLFGNRIRLPETDAWRGWASASAGASVAYIWMHVIPELNEKEQAFLQVAGSHLPAPQFRVYVAGLIGFICFYGFQHLRSREVVHPHAPGQPEHVKVYRLYLVGFFFYVALVGYLMIETAERGLLPLIIYWVVMALHFVSVDRSFEGGGEEYFEKRGRWLLALGVLIGGVVGMNVKLDVRLIATLLGLLSGAVIVNSIMMELYTKREGKFLPFLFGAAVFTGLLALI
jgi:hypothetical protein